MPNTARGWFEENIGRAEQLIVLVNDNIVPETGNESTRSDILRSSLMFVVGALDSYLSVAYVDLVSSTLRASSLQPEVLIPQALYEVNVPAAAAMRDYESRPNWRWRMAAKYHMSDKNMLNLGAIASRFNPLLLEGGKFFHDVVVDWADRPEANNRLFGISREDYGVLSNQDKEARKDEFVLALKQRVKRIIQRRHDCIHNCDRPKQSIQALSKPGTIANVIRDIRFLIDCIDEHLESAFADSLANWGFSGATRHAVGYPHGT